MKKFAVFINDRLDEGVVTAQRVIRYLEEHGASCWLPPRTRDEEYYDVSGIPDDIECAITLGGDGTFLGVARLLRMKNIAMFGINNGNLGYLTSAELDDIPACLDELLEDRFESQNRMMLGGTVKHADGGSVTDTALNDIVISRAGALRVVEFLIYVDDELLNVYDADGIIVSSATGSTGYNLSAGGPVVLPGTMVMIITPICPHTLSSRSVVVPAESKVKIELGRRRKTQTEEAIVTFDGNLQEKMLVDDHVEVTRAAARVNILRRPGSGVGSVFRSMNI